MRSSQYRVVCRRDLKGSNGRYFRDFLTADGTTSDVEIRECGIGGGRELHIFSLFVAQRPISLKGLSSRR